MMTTDRVTVYTIDKMPPVPNEFGSWERVERSQSRPHLWSCQYENSVGGVCGFLFNTKKAATLFAAQLSVVREHNQATAA